MTDYVMFGRPAYDAEPDTFELSINHKRSWFMAEMTRAEAIELLSDIQRHLEFDPRRLMTEGDLGLELPEDPLF